MVEARLCDVRPVPVIRSEFSQHLGALDMLGDIMPASPVRRIAKPLQHRHRLTFSQGGQLLPPVRRGLGRELRGDMLGERLLRMAQRGTHNVRDTPVAGQNVAVFVKPNPRHRGQGLATERRLGGATQMRRQAALGVVCQVPEAQHLHRDALVVEQCALPPVQRPDRCQARRCQPELRSQMLQHGDWKDLKRVQRASGHPQKADLQPDAQSVAVHAAA